MPGFEDLMAGVDLLIDDPAYFGEAFEHRPMREVRNGPASVDATRAIVPSVLAVFWNGADQLTDAGATARAGTNPVISVMGHRVPQGIRRMDRFVRAKTGLVYEVVGLRPDEFGRIECDVVQVPA